MLAVNHHSTDDLLVILGVILVLACLGGAAYMAYLRNVLACGLLIVVALIAAFLLL